MSTKHLELRLPGESLNVGNLGTVLASNSSLVGEKESREDSSALEGNEAAVPERERVRE